MARDRPHPALSQNVPPSAERRIFEATVHHCRGPDPITSDAVYRAQEMTRDAYHCRQHTSDTRKHCASSIAFRHYLPFAATRSSRGKAFMDTWSRRVAGHGHIVRHK